MNKIVSAELDADDQWLNFEITLHTYLWPHLSCYVSNQVLKSWRVEDLFKQRWNMIFFSIHTAVPQGHEIWTSKTAENIFVTDAL